jgi:hypothetical protein
MPYSAGHGSAEVRSTRSNLGHESDSQQARDAIRYEAS